MKPCRPHHGNSTPGCRLCDLARTREDYARLWGEPWPPGGAEPTPTLPPVPPAPRPVAEWPFLARTLARLRAPPDRGLGDTVERHLSRFGADAIKRLYTRLTGGDCGCADRQEALNARFPYPRYVEFKPHA